MRSALYVAILCSIAIHSPQAQSCPKENPSGPSIPSVSRTLSGTIVYHNALRQWIGLRLDASTCGQSEIELIPDFSGDDQRNEDQRKHLETLRGCRATVTGTLDLAPTGYYSTDIFQSVDKAVPDPSCIPQPPVPDFSSAKPNPAIHRYQAKLTVSSLGEGSIRGEARSNGRLLTPWQAYVHQFLTGGFVLYGSCADGFQISHVSGSPAANVSQIDYQAAMGADLEKGVQSATMTFTCTRESSPRINQE
jgi:hypothetical protein